MRLSKHKQYILSCSELVHDEQLYALLLLAAVVIVVLV